MVKIIVGIILDFFHPDGKASTPYIYAGYG
jgi:hypothetical protein